MHLCCVYVVSPISHRYSCTLVRHWPHSRASGSRSTSRVASSWFHSTTLSVHGSRVCLGLSGRDYCIMEWHKTRCVRIICRFMYQTKGILCLLQDMAVCEYWIPWTTTMWWTAHLIPLNLVWSMGGVVTLNRIWAWWYLYTVNHARLAPFLWGRMPRSGSFDEAYGRGAFSGHRDDFGSLWNTKRWVIDVLDRYNTTCAEKAYCCLCLGIKCAGEIMFEIPQAKHSLLSAFLYKVCRWNHVRDSSGTTLIIVCVCV